VDEQPDVGPRVQANVVAVELSVKAERASLLALVQQVGRFVLQPQEVLDGVEFAEGLLQNECVGVELAIAELLEQEQRLGRFDKHFGLAHLVLVRVNVHGVHDHLDA